jgi:hypothetical protein
MIPQVSTALDSVRWQRAFLFVVALTVFVFAVVAARWRPLWYDELFTLYVASEPSVGDTLRALLDGADTNPPVDYLLRHAVMAVLGSSPEAFRLASAAAFVAGLFAIYAYVRRRAPFLASAAAFLVPVATAATYFSHEGRAYALLVASAPLALWAWQRAVDEPRRPVRLAALFLSLCLGPFSHYYGVMNFLPVAAGEAWRSWRRRRLEAPIIATIATACVATLGLVPFARAAMAMKTHFWAAGFTAADLPLYYRGFLEFGGKTLLVLLAAVVSLAALSRVRAPRAARLEIPSHEWVAAVVLALTPLTAFVFAKVATGALTAKYTIAFVPGIAILAGYLLAYAEVTLRSAVAGLVAALAALALWTHVSAALSYRGSETEGIGVLSALQASSLPVAFDSPHQFLEIVHYAPQLAATGRLFYPMDSKTALEVRGFDNDERALQGLSRIHPLNLPGYREFTDRNERFLVVYTQEFWSSLVKALKRDGYCLVLLDRQGSTSLLQAFPGCRPTED